MVTGPLEGKTALVTGGSRGVGAGIVARLAADGARVAFTYANSKERAQDVADAVAATGGVAHAIRADSLAEEDVVSAVAYTVDRFGGLDILVNNAGVGSFTEITDMTMAQIDAMLTVNVRSAIVAIRESLAHLGEGGRIINIGSINADRMPFPGGVDLCHDQRRAGRPDPWTGPRARPARNHDQQRAARPGRHRSQPGRWARRAGHARRDGGRPISGPAARGRRFRFLPRRARGRLHHRRQLEHRRRIRRLMPGSTADGGGPPRARRPDGR